ncbi:MAG: hypothetical protein ACRDGE_06170 [Candidatus Limnocylindria bacterium]
MSMDERRIVRAIGAALAAEAERPMAARVLASIIRVARGYRWVGVYDAAGDEVVPLGWTGHDAPPAPGASALLVGVLGAAGEVAGLIQVEGEGSLAEEDRAFVERCADAAAGLWRGRGERS